MTCCTLSRLAGIAVVFGMLESIIGMAWNILIIVVIQTHKNDSEPLSPENIEEYHNGTSQWEILKNTLTSDKSLNSAHLFEIIVTALVCNSFWLIATLALAVGNAEKCRDMLKPWIGTTVIITVGDIAATIYFIFQAVKDVGDDEFDFNDAFFTNLYVFCVCLFSRGGPIVWIVNIALCISVAQRAKEIEVLKKRKHFSTDFNIAPYALQPPYEAFEAANSSPRIPKHHRPHTPPPDYEGPRGLVQKKRKMSFPSDYDTMTLPTSMGSSKTSASKQHLSQDNYVYDDRVELQHRTSATAETVVHHAYENKGLVMESEGWMGIPRPTLKGAH